MISIQSIRLKLGFNPTDKEDVKRAYKEYYGEIKTEDDSKPNIYSVLTDEESEYLDEYIMKYYKIKCKAPT
ncbi:MAG TPA: hypothetical protein DCG28_04990 [Lachnospiraceae bacterium]|nr:hypothetical protein [Lachnospiraceae bacterium]